MPFDRQTFKSLIKLATLDTHFIFNSIIYEQTDGVAMGSPLAPTLANIFLNHIEQSFFNQTTVPTPQFYRRYVDDTFLLFTNLHDAQLFFNYVNSLHPCIKFTMEVETSNVLSFLDINIRRLPSSFETSIYRKTTFTGLGSHFYSSCPISFKANSVLTLVNRAYKLSSSYNMFNIEINFLKEFFCNNGFTSNFFWKIVKKFLDNIHQPIATYIYSPKRCPFCLFSLLGGFKLFHQKRSL